MRVRRRLKPAIQAPQFTAGFVPDALIDHLGYDEIRLLMLAAFAIRQIGTAEVVKIRKHRTAHTIGRANEPAFSEKNSHLAAGDVVERGRGIHQGSAIFGQGQAAEQIRALDCRSCCVIVEIDPSVAGNEDAAASEVDFPRWSSHTN